VSELADLALPDATFEVVVSERALVPTGSSAVEFLIGPNPGVPAGPLRETASGGELSRVMLALMSVATAEGSGTVVFDEVDAGVGGATARAVGERLRGLAGERQVVCITHLPQIASLAERHFRVVKRGRLRDAAQPDVARTDVERLGRAELVEELCRMLGSDGDDEAARRHAEKLLQAA
jgi:DNA repair protein RecN (Recombination protein N)